MIQKKNWKGIDKAIGEKIRQKVRPDFIIETNINDNNDVVGNQPGPIKLNHPAQIATKLNHHFSNAGKELARVL